MAARVAAIWRLRSGLKIQRQSLHRVYATAPSLYKIFRPFSLTFTLLKQNL
jgi:hypothetical protein